MKRILLLSTIVALNLSAKAQPVTDTVSLGAQYANQVWYSLNNDEQATEPKDNWDIAFDVSSFGSSILINSMSEVALWEYNGDTSDWMALDTNGLSSWTTRHNSDTSWAYGAFSQVQAGVNVGWGTYNTITHAVEGDVLFVIKLTNGSYQKIWIRELASGNYTFRHAALDNSMDMTHSLSKSSFTDKNFGYFSLVSHSSRDREPVNTSWDLLFTQYNSFVPIPYNVSGVLSNVDVTVARAYPVDDPASYEDYFAHEFSGRMNAVGNDWKSFAGSWTVEDSLVYFVKDVEGSIWKLVFTGFGGSADGNFIFNKEKLGEVGIEKSATPSQLLGLYPNPAEDRVNVTYHAESNVTISVYAIDGKLMIQENLNQGPGLNQYTLDVSGIRSGMYVLQMISDQQMHTRQMIIK